MLKSLSSSIRVQSYNIFFIFEYGSLLFCRSLAESNSKIQIFGLYSIRDCCSPQSDYAVSVARSKSFFCPYEKFSSNPILQGNGKDIQSCGHGTMVRTPKNRMFYLCHSYLVGKYKQGRQPILEELKVGKDGWPYFVGGNKAHSTIRAKGI